MRVRAQAQCEYARVTCDYASCCAVVRRRDAAAHARDALEQHVRGERDARRAAEERAAAAEKFAACAVARCAVNSLGVALLSEAATESAIMHVLCVLKQNAEYRVAAAGGFMATSAALLRYPNNAVIAARACRVMSSLARDTAAKVLFCADRDVDAVVAALKTHISVATVAEDACVALHNMCWCSSANCARAGCAGGVESAVGALRTHSRTAEVARAACAALYMLCVDAGNLRRAAVADVASPVVAALAEHSGAHDVSTSACAVISVVCSDAEIRRRARAAGAAEAVVLALKTHHSSAEAAGWSCDALFSLYEETGVAAGAGVVEAVVAALKAHPFSAAAASSSCLALKRVCSDADARRLAGDLGGVEAVAAALEAHPQNAEVARGACLALYILCAVDVNRKRARVAGVVNAVVSTLKAHVDRPEVVQAACLALHHTSFGKSRTVAAAAGAAQAAVAALVTHAASARVALAACRALKSLYVPAYGGAAGDVEVRTVHVTRPTPRSGVSQPSHNAVSICANQAVVVALKAHKQNAAVAKEACEALIDMCMDGDREKRAGAAGGVEAVVAALEEHAADVGVVESACWALINMCVVDDNKERAARAGAVAALLAALNAHGAVSSKVALDGCLALNNITKHADGLAALKRDADTATAVLARLPASEEMLARMDAR